MGIGKTRSNCESERDTIEDGLSELLNVVAQVYNTEIDDFQAQLDSINDESISSEEKMSLLTPINQIILDIDERHLRIRQAVFIGIYSFWEQSLMAIGEYYKIKLEMPRPYAKDIIVKIYGKNIPQESVQLMVNPIKEFRNSAIHGQHHNQSAPQDILTMKDVLRLHPEFEILDSESGDYCFTTYNGLSEFLKFTSHTLKCIECYCREKTRKEIQDDTPN